MQQFRLACAVMGVVLCLGTRAEAQFGVVRIPSSSRYRYGYSSSRSRYGSYGYGRYGYGGGYGFNPLQYEQANSQALRNQAQRLALQHQLKERFDAQHQALKVQRTTRNIEIENAEFRDAPTDSRMVSGAALNYLIKQFGPNLSSVDFKDVKLTTAEMNSIRLQTAAGISLAGLNSTMTMSGNIEWPEELQYPELEVQRDAVEHAVRKLESMEPESLAAATQLKRVEHEINVLRSQAGTFLRVEKNDDVGANASRAFLKQLQGRIAQCHTSTQLTQLQSTLTPTALNPAELMQYIARNDLQFAPCHDSTGAAYRILHDKLAEEHRKLHSHSPTVQPGM